ncbi:MAG: tail fiber domain-containing protein [Sphingomonadales bacterium]|nr:tail fiber domain-containing protein [Sphingomonadales bacterium]
MKTFKKLVYFFCFFGSLSSSNSLLAQVGVGTSSPTTGTKFEVVGAGTTSATTALRVRNSSSSTPLMMVRDDGNVGIGTVNPSAGLEIVTDGSQLNALRVTSSQTYSSSPDAGIVFRMKYNTAGTYTSGAVISGVKENGTDGDQSGSLRFLTNNNGSIDEKMRITSGGNIILGTATSGGTSTPTYIDLGNNYSNGASRDKLKIYLINDGGITKYGFSVGSNSDLQYHSNSVHRFYIQDVSRVTIDANGNVTATAFTSSSDARLKNVLQSWDNEDQIDFVQFRWKNGPDARDHFGYLAQDVQKVLPDAVHTDGEGMLSVNYDEVHSFKISNLEQKNSKQEQRIKELENTVEELKKLIKKRRFRK